MIKSKKWAKLLSWIIFILFAGTEAFTVFQIWKLKMLPGKYFAMLLVPIVLITVLTAWLLFSGAGKRGVIVKRILGFIFSVCIITGCLIGSSAIHKLNQTMSSITASKSISVIIDVYVRSDDTAESIENCKNYRFSVADSTDSASQQSTVDAISDILGYQIVPQRYENVFTMVTALYTGDVDAIIMDQSYAGILEDVDGFGDFADRTKLIYEHIIQEELTADDLVVEETKPVIEDITTTPFLLYISGNDSRRQLLADGGSDVNILAAINPVTKQILLLNTPRDYFVANPAGGGAKDKLSHCGLGGIENSVEAMTLLYGCDISYYAKINFTGFKTLIDAIGGVTVYSDFAFVAGNRYDIRKGENHLNGAAALAFARERKAVSGGDNTRGKHQMKIISAMIEQLSASTLLANYGSILDSLDGMFATSIPSEDLAKLVKMQLSDMASWDIHSFAVTGDNGHDQPWALGGLYAYVMYPHEDEVEFAASLIDQLLAGEILTKEDLTFLR